MKQESENSLLKKLSFSKISLFKKSITLFEKRYISKTLGSKKSDAFDYGTLVEDILFQPNIISNKYTFTKPYKIEGKLGTFIESVAKQTKEGIKAYKELDLPFEANPEEFFDIAYKEADFKLELDVVVKNFKKQECQDYYNYLISDDSSKVYITQDDYLKATAQVEALRNNPFIKDIFTNKGFYQFEIQWQHPFFIEVMLTSFLDYIEFYDDKKLIIITDCKTTSKPYEDFENSIEEYNYDLQAALYWRAVKTLITTSKEYEKYKDYEIVYQNVVTENFHPFRAVRYVYSTDTIMMSEKTVNSVINDIIWAEKNNEWKYKKSLLDNNGVILI